MPSMFLKVIIKFITINVHLRSIMRLITDRALSTKGNRDSSPKYLLHLRIAEVVKVP